MRNCLTLSDRINKVVPRSNSGDKKKILYSTRVNDDGTLTLTESGTIDIQAQIQSEAELCDMSVLISRYLNGDPTALIQRTDGMYGDFTNCPKSYVDMLQNVIDAEAAWEKLPLDVRKSFDNNFNLWLSSAGDTGWVEKMTPAKPSVEPVSVVVDTVKESEVSE